MVYLKGRIALEEYNKALMARHPLMNTAANISGHSILGAQHAQQWPSNPGLGQNVPKSSYPYETNHRVSQFQVEKVDNGFVLRSGSKAKVCKDMEELRDFFVAIMVEHQMDK